MVALFMGALLSDHYLPSPIWNTLNFLAPSERQLTKESTTNIVSTKIEKLKLFNITVAVGLVLVVDPTVSNSERSFDMRSRG